MKEIPLTQGKVALVSDEDYERVSQHKWCARKNKDSYTWYALRGFKVNGKFKIQYMHRFILNMESVYEKPTLKRRFLSLLGFKHTSLNIVVDHINRDGLDNRRENLRVVTALSNGLNRRNSVRSRDSDYRGVSFIKWLGGWIVVSGKNRKVSFYRTEEEAANAYDLESRKFSTDSN